MKEPITSIGRVLTGNEQRDAIHFAIAPVEAAVQLSAGEDVALDGEGRATPIGEPIGIVDPFLKDMVRPGQRFWLFLYPNTITGLRHQWTHPAFEGRISKDNHISKSKAWIAEHARLLGITDDVLMEDAADWLEWEDYKVQHGSERWRDNFNATEFWHHYEVVTGKALPEDKKQSFYCCTC